MIKEYKYRIQKVCLTDACIIYIPEYLKIHNSKIQNIFSWYRPFKERVYGYTSRGIREFCDTTIRFNSEEQAKKFLKRFSSNPNEGYTPQQYHKAEQEKFQTKYIEI